jgi:hypothetical protein
VVRSRRLPSRRAREKNALLAPNHAQRLGAFLFIGHDGETSHGPFGDLGANQPLVGRSEVAKMDVWPLDLLELPSDLLHPSEWRTTHEGLTKEDRESIPPIHRKGPELGCDEDEAAFEQRLRKIAKATPSQDGKPKAIKPSALSELAIEV